MEKILQSAVVANLPVNELREELRAFLRPMLQQLPEERLREVGCLAVQGIIGAQSPVVTQMARALVRDDETIRPMASRFYRFVWNPRFDHQDLLRGLCGVAQREVQNTIRHAGGSLGSGQLREAVHGEAGRGLYSDEEHPSGAEREEAVDLRLPSDDCYGCQSAGANGDLCQLVLLCYRLRE